MCGSQETAKELDLRIPVSISIIVYAIRPDIHLSSNTIPCPVTYLYFYYEENLCL